MQYTNIAIHFKTMLQVAAVMAAERVKARKGFEFKMSKKVAELTQVVHMLFTRNHEREVCVTLTYIIDLLIS